MRSSDIKVGEFYGWRRFPASAPERVKVIAVGAERRPRESWRPATKDGVQIVPDAGRRSVEVVRPQTIVAPWESVVAEQVKANERVRVAEEARTRARRANGPALDAVRAALTARGLDLADAQWWDLGSRGARSAAFLSGERAIAIHVDLAALARMLGLECEVVRPDFTEATAIAAGPDPGPDAAPGGEG